MFFSGGPQRPPPPGSLTPPTVIASAGLQTGRHSPRLSPASTTPDTPQSTGMVFSHTPPPYITTTTSPHGHTAYVPGYSSPPSGYRPYHPSQMPMTYPRQVYTPPSPGQHIEQIPISQGYGVVPSTTTSSTSHTASNPQAWNCSECTFLNHGELATCEMCDMPKVNM